jgi:hypothetical protein
MWTLWIISFVFATDDTMEPRVTRYAEYQEAWQCEDAWRKLNYKFENGEMAFCTSEEELGRFR